MSMCGVVTVVVMWPSFIELRQQKQIEVAQYVETHGSVHAV